MRITTTLDEALAKEAQKTAKRLDESMSAFVSEAVRLRLEKLKKEAAFKELKTLVRPDYALESYKESLRQLRNE